MKKVVKIVAVSAWVLPFMASAQSVTYLQNLLGGAKALLDQLVVFLVALAVVWFIFNVIRYAMSSDPEKQSQAKTQMIWGIVAIAVIVSIWGLVAILQGIFGVGTNAAGNLRPLLPQ